MSADDSPSGDAQYIGTLDVDSMAYDVEKYMAAVCNDAPSAAAAASLIAAIENEVDFPVQADMEPVGGEYGSPENYRVTVERLAHSEEYGWHKRHEVEPERHWFEDMAWTIDGE